MNTWLEGNTVVMTITFTDPEDLTNGEPTPIDPSTVSIGYAIATTLGGTVGTPTVYNYVSPNPTPAVGVVGRISEGVYEVWENSTGKSGYWKYRGDSTGLGQAAEEDWLYVQPKAF